MDQGRDPGLMQGGEEQSAGKTDTLGHIVILLQTVGIEPAAALAESDNQPRRGFEKGFFGARAERPQCLQPFAAGAAFIESAFLFLGGDADRTLRFGRGHDAEMPGLVIGAVRRRSGRDHRRLDDLARHRLLAERPAAAAGAHGIAERTRAFDAFGVSHLGIRLPWQRLWIGHISNGAQSGKQKRVRAYPELWQNDFPCGSLA